MTRPPPPSLYDEHFYAWTQEQAAALRRMSPDVADHTVDMVHVAEEIEDLGQRDLREVESNLARIFEHLLKIENDPTSIDVPRWRAEVRSFQDSAQRGFSPSIRQIIDLPLIWRKACKRSQAYFEDIGRGFVAPPDCPFDIDDFLRDGFAVDPLVEKLRKPS